MSIQALLRYEGKLLTPIRDAQGHRRYDPQELAAVRAKLPRKARGARKAIARQRAGAPPSGPTRDTPSEPRVSGALTKRAFEMFTRGESRASVAIELAESVENVNWLYENWFAMSGRKVAAANHARASESIPWSAPPREPSQPALRLVTETEIRARPPELRSEADRDLLRWIDKLDEENRQRAAKPKDDGDTAKGPDFPPEGG